MLAGIILSYNTPELTDSIYEQLSRFANHDFTLHVFDNGSDPDKRSKYTAYRIEKNRRIAGGWNEAVRGLNLTGNHSYKYLWLITNDTQWAEGNPLDMIKAMEERPKIGMLHPSLTPDSPTGWRNMICRGEHTADYLIAEWMIDIIAPVIRADVFRMLQGFDENFSRGWGMDWDFCYRMYKKGYVGVIDQRVQMRHLLGGTYRSGKADEPDSIRTIKAEDEAERYLSEKYGGNWRNDIQIHNQRKIDKYLGL